MKHYTIHTICFFAFFILTSCLKDLELLPKDPNVYTSEKAWREENTYLAVLAKIYAGFGLNGQNAPSEGFDIQGGDQGEATFTRSYWNLQEMCTDESICAWSDNGIDGMNYIQWNSNNRFIELVYNRCLVTIAFCNEYLSQTTDDKLSQRGMSHIAQTVTGYRAEVRAVRAMKYMLLMDLYANVPFADYVGSQSPPQKDRAFLFNFVETELSAVVEQLPVVSSQTYARFTKGVAYTALAKLYLNAEVYIGTPKYSECIEACQNVTAQGYYDLEPQYKHLFMADNYKSKEIIFPIVQDGQKAPSFAGTTYLIAASYNAAMKAKDNAGLNVDGWQGLRSRPQLVELFDNNDSRRSFYTDGFTKDINNVGEFIQGYPVIKFVNKNQDGTRGSSESYSDIDVTFYRLADVYLMKAEAELRKDNAVTPTTLGLVNQLRTRAGVATFSSITLQDILDERARELYYEGHRRTDLIRFNKFTKGYNWAWKNRIKDGSDVDDIYKIYPLPAADLSANPNLKQNPGY